MIGGSNILKNAIEIAEADPSTDFNESTPAIPPMTNSEPPVWIYIYISYDFLIMSLFVTVILT
jgi:hypothetical protein